MQLVKKGNSYHLIIVAFNIRNSVTFCDAHSAEEISITQLIKNTNLINKYFYNHTRIERTVTYIKSPHDIIIYDFVEDLPHLFRLLKTELEAGESKRLHSIH